MYYSTLKKIAFAFFLGGVGGLRLKQLETVSFFRATKVRGSLIETRKSLKNNKKFKKGHPTVVETVPF